MFKKAFEEKYVKKEETSAVTDESPSPWSKSLSSFQERYNPQSIISRARQSLSLNKPSNSFDNVFNNLIQAESGGKHYDSSGGLLKSPVGALGITQVMPDTAKGPGYGVKPIQNDSEEEYIRFGRDYLKALVDNYGGDYRKAVAAYNAGPGNVNKAVEASKKKGGDWSNYLPRKSETLPYMDKILGTRKGVFNGA